MTYGNERGTGTPTPIVETAAGTTSPDNSNSGSKAYVIAIIAIVAMLLYGIAMSGCVSLMSNFVAEEMDTYGYNSDEYWDDWEQDVDDSWDIYGIRDDGYSDDAPNQLIPVQDVMFSDLAIRNVTLDSCISASDYANAQTQVSSFVRDLVVYDRDAVQELSEPLREGSWGQMEVSSALEQAIGVADKAIEEVRAMELPEPEGENASKISRDLETGKTQVVRRWEAIRGVLVLLSESSEVGRQDLLDADDQVVETTEDAAENLRSALATSARR